MIGKIDLIKVIRNVFEVRLITAKRLTECRGPACFTSNKLNADLAADLVMTCIDLYDADSIITAVERQMHRLKADINSVMHWGATCPNCDWEIEDYPWLY